MKRLFLALVCLPLWAWAGGGLPNQPYIYVQGAAEVKKPADQVIVRFTISAANLKQEVATRGVQQQAATIFALLDAKKIPHDDVVADDIESEREYEEPPIVQGGPGKFTGYRVNRGFSLKLREVSLLSSLVADLLKLDLYRFAGIEEGLSNRKELDDQVWADALADARAKADKMLKPVGMKVASVYAISPLPIPEIEKRMLAPEAEIMASRTEPKQIMPDEYRMGPVSVSESVHVIYLIEPAR